MSSVIADTHVIIWFLENPAKLTPAADAALRNAVIDPHERIFVSAISLIEIQYLIEKQRIPTPVLTNLLAELKQPDSILDVIPVDLQLAVNLGTISRTDVPEMPDRIIAVTAVLRNLPLVTADERIRASGVSVIW